MRLWCIAAEVFRGEYLRRTHEWKIIDRVDQNQETFASSAMRDT